MRGQHRLRRAPRVVEWHGTVEGPLGYSIHAASHNYHSNPTLENANELWRELSQHAEHQAYLIDHANKLAHRHRPPAVVPHEAHVRELGSVCTQRLLHALQRQRYLNHLMTIVPIKAKIIAQLSALQHDVWVWLQEEPIHGQGAVDRLRTLHAKFLCP